MRMSRPIKISNELFSSLQRDAMEQGISMQQALSARLMALQVQAEALSQDRDELDEALSSAEAELQAAMAEGSENQSSIGRLRNEREELLAVIEEMEASERHLESELLQLQATVRQADNEMQESKSERERLASQRNTLLNILLALGVVALLTFAVRKFSPPQTTEEPAVPATVNMVPSCYQ